MSDHIYTNGEIVKADDELMHYGRLGMKWGKHMFGTSKAYVKASKHLDKLNAKTDEKKMIARKAAEKSDRYREFGLNKKDAHKGAIRASKKAEKAEKKAKKFENKMADVFKETKVSDLSEDARSVGKDYLYVLKRDYKRKREE